MWGNSGKIIGKKINFWLKGDLTSCFQKKKFFSCQRRAQSVGLKNDFQLLERNWLSTKIFKKKKKKIFFLLTAGPVNLKTTFSYKGRS